MQERTSPRGMLEFPVIEREGGFKFWCRALNVSSTGILLERNPGIVRGRGNVLELELHLPGLTEPLVVVANCVWAKGSQLGLKFLGLADADRLTLAEALDELKKRGGVVN